jgi:hypothetical protein
VPWARIRPLSRAQILFILAYLGLAPQALFCRPLSRASKPVALSRASKTIAPSTSDRAITFVNLLHHIACRTTPDQTYTAADGLPRDRVYKVVADPRGFLWFCTNDGLSRFDGYEFTNYSTANGLPHRIINDLLITRGGDYWAANWFRYRSFQSLSNHSRTKIPGVQFAASTSLRTRRDSVRRSRWNKFHLRHIYDKLQVHTKSEAVAKALQHGLTR